jgi:hypothetical protein
MKLDTLDISEALTPFNVALGDSKGKIVNDIKSLLGREEKRGETDPKQGITVKLKDWKATAGYKLTRTTGESIQLPPNSPATILLCFGMRFNELAKASETQVDASIPKACEHWVNDHKQNKSAKVEA